MKLFKLTITSLALLFSGCNTKNSNIPVVHTLNGSWSYFDAITLEKFSAEIIEKKLNLFNNHIIMEYSFKGYIDGTKNWKPYISAVHIGQTRQKIDNELKTIIYLTPIVRTKKDENYKGDKISFDIKVKDNLTTNNWDKNIFYFKALDLNDTVEVFHGK